MNKPIIIFIYATRLLFALLLLSFMTQTCVSLDQYKSNDETYSILQKAEEGDIESCFIAGTLYANGVVLEQNLEKARHFYMKASEKGSIRAKRCLAFLLEFGLGGEIDYKTALELYLYAASEGDAAACLGVSRFIFQTRFSLFRDILGRRINAYSSNNSRFFDGYQIWIWKGMYFLNLDCNESYTIELFYQSYNNGPFFQDDVKLVKSLEIKDIINSDIDLSIASFYLINGLKTNSMCEKTQYYIAKSARSDNPYATHIIRTPEWRSYDIVKKTAMKNYKNYKNIDEYSEKKELHFRFNENKLFSSLRSSNPFEYLKLAADNDSVDEQLYLSNYYLSIGDVAAYDDITRKAFENGSITAGVTLLFHCFQRGTKNDYKYTKKIMDSLLSNVNVGNYNTIVEFYDSMIRIFDIPNDSITSLSTVNYIERLKDDKIIKLKIKADKVLATEISIRLLSVILREDHAFLSGFDLSYLLLENSKKYIDILKNEIKMNMNDEMILFCLLICAQSEHYASLEKLNLFLNYLYKKYYRLESIPKSLQDIRRELCIKLLKVHGKQLLFSSKSNKSKSKVLQLLMRCSD